MKSCLWRGTALRLHNCTGLTPASGVTGVGVKRNDLIAETGSGNRSFVDSGYGVFYNGMGKADTDGVWKGAEQMGGMIGFAIWALGGVLFAAIGIAAYVSKKPAGFWANTKAPMAEELSDVAGYNHAVAKLFWAYAAVFVLLGLPLLDGQNSPWAILSILGIMAETIAAMVCYVLVIERKYRKK